ncbi:MAG: diguanylate cyclase [Ruminococcaceae bacterium]|nr:diguanylate cyclase [Oscillospiraceae bacterium]
MKNRRIAVFVAAPYKTYAHEITSGMFEAAKKRGVTLCVFSVLSEANIETQSVNIGEAAIINLPDLKKFDAIILMKSTILNPIALNYIDEIIDDAGDVPLISICCDVENAYNIYFDEYTGIAALAKHFVEVHGKKKFCYVGGPVGNKVADNCLLAFKQSMEDLGITISDSEIYRGNYMRESGAAAAEYFIKSGQHPEAILCTNDDMALGVSDYLSDVGIKIPEEIAIAGEDATKEAAIHVPSITSVLRPTRKLGMRAVETALDLLDGKKIHRDQSFETEMVIGNSCGCGKVDESCETNYIKFLTKERDRFTKDHYAGVTFNTYLSGAEDMNDLRNRLSTVVEQFAIRRLYVCVSESHLSEQPNPGSFSARIDLPHSNFGNMRLIFGYDGKRVLSRKSFASTDLLPDMEDHEGESLVFCSMYSLNRNYGYVVFDAADISEFMFRSFCQTLATAVENLCLHFAVQNYAKQLEQLYIRDTLTGLLNRRGYVQCADELFEKARNRKKGFMVLSADIDFLKSINDNYGHKEGDVAISSLAACLKRVARPQDICVHLSGDEFMVLGIDYTQADMEQFISSVYTEIDRFNVISDKPYKLAASLGGTVCVPDADTTLEYLTNVADNAMYTEKKLHHQGCPESMR